MSVLKVGKKLYNQQIP